MQTLYKLACECTQDWLANDGGLTSAAIDARRLGFNLDQMLQQAPDYAPAVLEAMCSRLYEDSFSASTGCESDLLFEAHLRVHALI